MLRVGCKEPGCILFKTHTVGMPVAPQVHAKVEGLHRPKVQRSVEARIEICALFCQYTKEYSLSYI